MNKGSELEAEIEINEKGEYVNCRFYKEKECSALKVWYNECPDRHCAGCTFFKTEESDT